MSGIRNFQKRMQAIPVAVRKAVEPTLMKAGYDIADAMEALAPEDSGDLKGSIAVTGPGQQTPPYSQPGGSMTVEENAVAITVGNTDVRYPHLQEYGTKKHAAQPYFWPAFRTMRAKTVRQIKNAIRKAVREAK